MKPKHGITAVAIALVAAAAAPAAAAAGPAQITSFTLSKSCVTPGGSVSANATVQNTTALPVQFYSKPWVTEGGFQVYSGGTAGPYPAPAFTPVSQSQTVQIPAYTPWGYYTIHLGIGPSSSDPTSWSQRSATLAVSPYCF